MKLMPVLNAFYTTEPGNGSDQLYSS